MVHFLIECKALEGNRNYDLIDNSIGNPKDRMIKLLFQSEDYQGTGYMVKKLWWKRRFLLKYIQELEERNKEDNRNILNPMVNWNSDPGPMRRGHGLPEIRSLRNSMIRG